MLILSLSLILVSALLAIYFYLFLFKINILPNSIPRLDIQRYDNKYENILFIGDSFFDPRNPDIYELQKELINNKGLNLINVSEANTGPLHYLYALETYLNKYDFKKVAFIFYGGNDIANLHLNINKKSFQQRLLNRMHLWEAVKLTIRHLFKRIYLPFKKPINMREAIFEGLNQNMNSLLINDMILFPEKSKSTFEHFIKELNHIKASKNLQIGCIYIPASRHLEDHLFKWWSEQKINWDDRLKYNQNSYHFIKSKLPEFCNWFVKDLTNHVKDMISNDIRPYLDNDIHFHPNTGHQLLLREIQGAL